MNKKFPLLSLISIIIRILGIIFILISLFLIIDALAHLKNGDNVIYLSIGIGLIFSGFIFVIIGESIGVLFAIEKNTRHSANYTQSIINENQNNTVLSDDKIIQKINIEETNKCPECNFILDKNSVFCGNCGNRIKK